VRMCLPSRCSAMNVHSGSIIPALRRHVSYYRPDSCPCFSNCTSYRFRKSYRYKLC
jgi:hypothetical protein